MDYDISYKKPDEQVKSPFDVSILVQIPFVGIYNTILDAMIESEVEREADYYQEEENEEVKSVTVNLREIYRNIADATLTALGLSPSEAVYAGCDSPKYYNYRDDQLYIWLNKECFNRLSKEYAEDFDPETDDVEKLIELMLYKASDEQVIDIETEDWNGCAMAIFKSWYDDGGIRGVYYNGSECISNNTEVDML